jgi:DNA-binding CsgD family transcriptional regulator
MASEWSELLLTLYRVAHEQPLEQFHDAALNLLRPLVPFDTSMWGTATAVEGGLDIHTIHLHRTSPQMLVDYALVQHLDTAAASMIGLPMAVRAFHANEWTNRGAMRAFLHRYGHRNNLIAADSQPQQCFVRWISLFRTDPDAHGTARDVGRMRQLTPHLMQALSMNRVVHLQRAMAAGPGTSPHGAAIADVRGVLYHHNPLFAALLRREWPGWAGQHLPAPVIDAVQTGPTQWRGRDIVLQAQVDHGLLFLRARARCKADLLGPRELQVARLVARGFTHKAIAQQLARAPATVRNQIQAIYGKLEVGGIAALVEALREGDAGAQEA